MRTFHTGGIASAEDITQGLPRVEELFESRRPKSMAIMSEISGVVSQDDTKKNVVIKVTGKDENGAEEVKSYSIPFTQHSRVMPGDRVEKGDIITREGVLYPQDILAIKGLEDVQNYLINEVQKVYRLQGVEINDKHIEVIVRQMCRKVRVTDSGSSDLIGGALAIRLEVEYINAELQKRVLRRLGVEDEQMEEKFGHLIHALFDGRQIFGRKRTLVGKVIVKTVFDSRSDRHLSIGLEFFDSLSHQVSGRVTNDFERFRILFCDDGQCGVMVNDGGGIHQLIIKTRGNCGFAKARADALGYIGD